MVPEHVHQRRALLLQRTHHLRHRLRVVAFAGTVRDRELDHEHQRERRECRRGEALSPTRREEQHDTDAGCEHAPPRRDAGHRREVAIALCAERQPREYPADASEHQREQATAHAPAAAIEQHRSDQRERRDRRQQVVRLLAADHREHQQHRDQPREAEAHRRLCEQCAQRSELATQHERPRQYHQREHDAVPPPGATMRARALDAVDAVDRLAQEDRMRVVRPAVQGRGNRPCERDRGAGQQGQRECAEVAPQARAQRLARPPWRGQRDHADVEQHHRALDEDAEADRAAGQCDAAPEPRAGEVDDAVHAQQHAGRQQHVEHDRVRERAEVDRAEQDPDRMPRGLVGVREPQREAMHQREARSRTHQGHHARGPRVHAGEQPAEVDQPEQHRRLVRIGRAVEMRHEELATVAHFPCDREIARLVDRNRRQQEHQRHQQQQREQQRGIDQMAPGRRGRRKRRGRHRAAGTGPNGDLGMLSLRMRIEARLCGTRKLDARRTAPADLRTSSYRAMRLFAGWTREARPASRHATKQERRPTCGRPACEMRLSRVRAACAGRSSRHWRSS